MMKKTICSVICILIILFVAPHASAQNLERVSFKSETGENIDGYLMRPKRAGRFRAIVALHGCSGLFKRNGNLTSRHADWGKRFVRWGYVVLFPDSFGSRGYRSLCKIRNRPVRQKHRKRDVQGARKWLAKQKFVQSRNISLVGWSNGGGTTIRLAYSKRGVGFKRAIAFYPGCTSMSKKNKLRRRLPLTILMGRDDDWTPAEPCQKLIRKWGGRIVLYQGAYHNFDAPNSRLRIRRSVAYSKRGDGIVHVGTNKKARTKAIAYMRSIFK